MKLTTTKVVYTAVFGNYDHVSGVNPEWDCDFVCFTDNAGFISPGWRVVIVKLNDETPAQANRRYKILAHKYLSNYEQSLYVDGNVRIISDPSPLFKKYLENNVIAIPKHQERNCAYAEARLCIERGIVDKTTTENQMKGYLSDGFPVEHGLTENGIILRKNCDESVVTIMTEWWGEYCAGGKRDQLSLPYLIWRSAIKFSYMDETARNKNKYFRIAYHKSAKRTSLIGRLVDHVACSKNRSLFYRGFHKILHKLGGIDILRRVIR